MSWLNFYCPCCTVRYAFNSALLRAYPICGYCDCPLLRLEEEDCENVLEAA